MSPDEVAAAYAEHEPVSASMRQLLVALRAAIEERNQLQARLDAAEHRIRRMQSAEDELVRVQVYLRREQLDLNGIIASLRQQIAALAQDGGEEGK